MRDRTVFWPKYVFVSGDAKEDPLTSNVLERLPNAHVTYLDEFESTKKLESEVFKLLPQSEFRTGSIDQKYTYSKKVLILMRHKGAWLKSCPGTSSHVCCNLYTVDPGEGCPLDCTYCYLQSYLQNNPILKLYSNVNDLLNELNQKFIKDPTRLFRLGTGELIDSLVWDDLTDFSKSIVPFFANHPNAVLELKSKDDFVDNLLDLKDQHKGRTVISWSVNARSVSEHDELHTATVDERLVAARKVVEAGYRVGFHFDPIVYFDNWESEYAELVDRIFSTIDPKNVAWVSVSTLRYQNSLQEMMLKRFPNSKLPFGEQFLAKDSKLRYIQPIRFKLTRHVWNLLKRVSDKMPVYMCMESATAWREIAGGAPIAGTEIREVFAKKATLPVLL